jgi:hypothetical protein
MLTIHTLRPNVTREEAIRLFSWGPAAWLRRIGLGPLHLLADVYIPFYLFRINVTSGGRTETRLLALDAITGSLDPYAFERVPDSAELVSIRTRNCLEPALNESHAARLAIDKTRRVLFSRGFFRMRNLKMTATRVSEALYVPYWVGFQGTDSKANLLVMDAIRRQFEGAKVKRLLEDWLREICPGAEF